MRNFLSAAEVAAQLGCSRGLVYLLIRQKKLKGVAVGTGEVRPRVVVDPADLDDFIREGKARAAAS